jgi:hypothetical protein
MSENFTQTLHEVSDKIDALKDHITAKADEVQTAVLQSYGEVDTGTDNILMWVAKNRFSAFIWAGYTITAILLGVVIKSFF